MDTFASTGTSTNADTEVARLCRHLEAIFATPCTCDDPDDDTCPACIAEHALYMAGDHPAARNAAPA